MHFRIGTLWTLVVVSVYCFIELLQYSLTLCVASSEKDNNNQPTNNDCSNTLPLVIDSDEVSAAAAAAADHTH